MAKFPEVSNVPMTASIKQRIRTKTLFSKYDDMGEEQRKQKWLYPRRDTILTYKGLDKDDVEILWEFYIARMGAYAAFNFFLPEPEGNYPSYEGEYVGVGDGSTEIFNLPCKTSSGRTVYLDGSSETEGVGYNFTAEGGADGADKIDFSDSSMSPPNAGVKITIDFTGILKIRSRFAEDKMDFETLYDRLANTGLELKGLLNE